MKNFGFHLSQELYQQLKLEAELQNTSMAQICRQALSGHLVAQDESSNLNIKKRNAVSDDLQTNPYGERWFSETAVSQFKPYKEDSDTEELELDKSWLLEFERASGNSDVPGPKGSNAKFEPCKPCPEATWENLLPNKPPQQPNEEKVSQVRGEAAFEQLLDDVERVKRRKLEHYKSQARLMENVYTATLGKWFTEGPDEIDQEWA